MRFGSRPHPLLLISVASVLLGLPLFFLGFPLGHDAAWHLTYEKHFAGQFWEGELYPRWLPDANAGLGSPIFFVYGPVPYWVGSLFRPLTNWLAVAEREVLELTLSAFIALLASGLAAYLWLRDLHDEVVAACGAVIYMVIPYHLVADLYIRSALPEYWSFVWMPLALYFIRRVVEGSRSALAGLAAAYAMLIMTHLFSTLLFSVWAILYAWLLLYQARKWPAAAWVLCGFGLGIGLAAIYLAPAVGHERHIPISRHNLMPKYYYANNFLGASLSGDEGITFITLLTLILAGWAFFRTRSPSTKPLARERGFWFAVSLFCVFMMLPPSRPVWELLPILQGIEFPWRFNTILVVCTTALLTMAMGKLQAKADNPSLVWLTLVPWVLVMSVVGTVKMKEMYNRNVELGRTYVAAGYEVHIPVWARGENWGTDALREMRRVSSGMGLVRGEEAADASVLKWAPRDIRIRVRSEREGSTVVRQLYYPGWEAHDAASGAGLKIEPTRREGLIRVWVPAGDHEVVLRLHGGAMEGLGTAISGVCFVALAGGLVVRRLRLRA